MRNLNLTGYNRSLAHVTTNKSKQKFVFQTEAHVCMWRHCDGVPVVTLWSENFIQL